MKIVRFTFNEAKIKSFARKTNRFMFSISQMHKNLVLTIMKYLLVNILLLSFNYLCLRSFSLAHNLFACANYACACACVAGENQALRHLLMYSDLLTVIMHDFCILWQTSESLRNASIFLFAY